VKDFLQTLAVQRWDDHRYYHHSRINQTLHLISAASFLVAYGLLFFEPATAAILAWCVSMTTRQAGHFFFEPRGYDHVNQVTDEYKEEIKVGYNIRRKIVLMGAWAASPLLVWLLPGLFGLSADAGLAEHLHVLGLVWLAVGVGGLLFRVVHLTIMHRDLTGIVWLSKILTDPFHDISLYYKAPVHLLRGELIDPQRHVRSN
jgi:hypothetical protein